MKERHQKKTSTIWLVFFFCRRSPDGDELSEQYFILQSSTLLRFTTQGYIPFRPSLSGAAKTEHQPNGWCFCFAPDGLE